MRSSIHKEDKPLFLFLSHNPIEIWFLFFTSQWSHSYLFLSLIFKAHSLWKRWEQASWRDSAISRGFEQNGHWSRGFNFFFGILEFLIILLMLSILFSSNLSRSLIFSLDSYFFELFKSKPTLAWFQSEKYSKLLERVVHYDFIFLSKDKKISQLIYQWYQKLLQYYLTSHQQVYIVMKFVAF